MAHERIKNTITKLESLYEIFNMPAHLKLEDLEESVLHLSNEVQCLDLAADQTLKKELSVLENALANLSSLLKKQQENIEVHVKEIHHQQRTLSAYARVANNNLGSIA